MTKECTLCREAKPFSEFSKKPRTRDGLQHRCKHCSSVVSLDWRRSEDGHIREMYLSQRLSSKKRGHELQNYTFEEFKSWVKSQNNYSELYSAWVSSGFDRWVAPSADRLEDSMPYALDNLRLVEWKTNSDKESRLRKKGLKYSGHKKVVSTDISTGEETEYVSIREASRQTGADRANISRACRNKTSILLNLKWKYITD